MMATESVGARIAARTQRGEHVLPAPIAGRPRILLSQSVRYLHAAVAMLHRPIVLNAHGPQMSLHRGGNRIGKHRDAILLSLAVAYDHLGVVEIDVLHAQSHCFHEPQPAAVE